MKKVALVFLVIMTGIICFSVLVMAKANAAQKAPVEVLQKGNDSIGIRLAYFVKEDIRKSECFRLSSNDMPRLKIIMITEDLADEIATEQMRSRNRNLKSVAALVYTYLTKDHEFFLNGALLTIGAKTIKEQAQEIVARIDKLNSK